MGFLSVLLFARNSQVSRFKFLPNLPGRLLGFTLTKASAMSPALKITEQRLAMISGLNYGKQLTLIG